MKPIVGLIENLGAASGGAAYERMVAEALEATCDVRRMATRCRKWIRGFLANMILNGRQVSCEPDALILTVNTAAFLDWSRHRHQKKILIWHHHDANAFAGGRPMLRVVYEVLFHRILSRASEIDQLVVVGEFWRSFFSKYDFRQIEVVYNPFDLELFKKLSAKLDHTAVRRSLGVPNGAQVVYIGQFQKLKGARFIFDALKHRKDLFLIGSGRKDIDLPVCHFSGSYEEYLQMLGACDVALSMSRMYEGWNRTAHEAMLMNTPVIGNAIGNSGELLNGARQLICHDYKALPTVIDQVVRSCDSYQDAAREYVFGGEFSSEHFSACWQKVVSRLFE